MTELDEKIKKLAEDAVLRVFGCDDEPSWDSNIYMLKAAIYAGIRAFAEQRPTEAMTSAASHLGVATVHCSTIYETMMAEAIKSLPQPND